MKSRFFYCLCKLFILGMVFCHCSKENLHENATLSIDPAKADFGTISADDPIAFHDVSLTAKNLGREPLNIGDIQLPEGFSYGMSPRKVIEGGQEATLKITMDIRKFSAPVSATAYVLSNDPSQPRMAIELTANIVRDSTHQTLEIGDVPDINFDHKAVDFGPVSRDKMIEHRFEFSNIGKKPLKIQSIETMCACLTGVPSMTEIPPGSSAAIVAKFEAYKYGGTKPWKSLRIATNDPDEPVINLTVSAHIVDAAILEPEVVLLHNVQSGRGASAEVKLIQGGKEELLIKRTETSSPKISVTASPLEGERKGYLLRVEVAPDMPLGKFEEVISIFTNYGNYSGSKLRTAETAKIYRDYSRLTLPVKGSVAGAISVSPETINFGSVTPGKPVRRKLIVSSSTSSFEIDSLGLASPSFKISCSPIEKGQKYEITIEFLPELPKRQIKDELIIATTNSRLIVPVFATVDVST